MRCCVGTDIVEIERIREAFEQWGKRFLDHVYTEKEIEICRNYVPSLAVNFAAKEAVIKVLQPRDEKIFWKDMEVLEQKGGKPFVTLHGRARDRADALGITSLEISLSHSRDNALAVAVGLME